MSKNPDNIPAKAMFDFSDAEFPRIVCPWCDAVPHMVGVAYGPDAVSTSGSGLSLHMICETGHAWMFRTVDHSGGTWLSIAKLPTYNPS